MILPKIYYFSILVFSYNCSLINVDEYTSISESLLSFECNAICHVYIYIVPFPSDIICKTFKTEVMADLLFIYTNDALGPNYLLIVCSVRIARKPKILVLVLVPLLT